MKHTNKTLLIALSVLCGTASAGPDAAADSAELTAKNIALVSSALAAHQKRLNSVATTRASHIQSVTRLATNARRESDREVEILNQTGGAEIIKMFEALCEHGDRAALISAQTEAVEAAAKADIAAAYSPLAISTEKLDRAAKTLAVLAKQQSDKDRAKYFLQFLRDTRDESEKLLKASDEKRAGADTKLNVAVEGAASTVSAASASSGE